MQVTSLDDDRQERCYVILIRDSEMIDTASSHMHKHVTADVRWIKIKVEFDLHRNYHKLEFVSALLQTPSALRPTSWVRKAG